MKESNNEMNGTKNKLCDFEKSYFMKIFTFSILLFCLPTFFLLEFTSRYVDFAIIRIFVHLSAFMCILTLIYLRSIFIFLLVVAIIFFRTGFVFVPYSGMYEKSDISDIVIVPEKSHLTKYFVEYRNKNYLIIEVGDTSGVECYGKFNPIRSYWCDKAYAGVIEHMGIPSQNSH